MLKILTLAAVTATLLAATSPAQAFIIMNGGGLNGIGENGFGENGFSLQGASLSGASAQGGVKVLKLELPAQ